MAITGTGNGGVLVAPPACVPARYGLLSVAEVEDRADGHWLAGIEYELEACGELYVLTPKCNQVVPDLDAKTTGGGVDADNFSDPFTLVAGYECSGGGRPLSEAWEHAEARLDRGESRALERTFWTGKDRKGNTIRQSLGDNPDVVDLTPVGGALSITDGVAVLESWAGVNYPCSPIIHAQRGLGVYMGQSGLVAADKNEELRVTGTGSRVVIGGGYLDSGPMGNDPAAGEGWIFVTGSLKVLRGVTFFTPTRDDNGAAVDRLVNDVTVFAERTYAIQQDCIIGAVRVLLQSCC